MSTARPVPHEHIVFSELDEKEGVLVDLNTKRYYTLNETAIFVWRLLEKKFSADEIARELIETYEVTPEQATASVSKLLAGLSQRNLLTAA